jgi:ABC-type nickel/cobalt efflux system permease component RcnA
VEAAVEIAGALDFSWLFAPVERIDESLTHLLDGAPLLVALGIAFVLGLRHASDPDHLVAVTSLVAADRDGGTRDATRLGAWWGLGHATMLLALGIPLIALHSSLPAWLESAAEKGIGLIIIVLAARVIWKWAQGEYRSGRHEHAAAHGPPKRAASGQHRHLHRERPREHGHRPLRTPAQAFGIGTLHGLAGTGAVVVLLLAALPSSLEAGLALAVFAPMSILSMAACTTAFAWVLTRPIIEPVYRAVLIPSLGAFGLLFGLWYAGLG